MRQVLAIAAAAAVVLLVASPAGAGSAKGPTLKSLAAQVKSLQKQVTTLKKRTANDEFAIGVTLEYAVCSTAVTADTFQDTFTGLDANFTTRSGTAYFGAQSPVNDYKSCQDFKVVRAHNQSPPNTNILRALLDIFSSRSFAAQQPAVNLPGQFRDLFGQLFVLPRQVGVGIK
jgi:opacity protein-like surface antigen